MYVCLMGHIWHLVGQGRLCQSFMQFAVSSSLNIHTHKKNVADYSQMLNLGGEHVGVYFTLLCMRAQLLQPCPALWDPVDGSPPGSSVHGILQARVLEWGAMPSSGGSSPPRDWTHTSCVSCVAGRFFTTELSGKPILLFYFIIYMEIFIVKS